MSNITVHRGPWDEESRKSQALRFVEKYNKVVDSPDRRATASDSFFAPTAVYHDTKGGALIGGSNCWQHVCRLLFPFANIQNEPSEMRVVPCDQDPGQQIVYAQFVQHFLLKGDLDEEEILVPKFAIYTLGEGEGEEGLQIQEVRQFYDNAIIGRYVSEKRKREAKKRSYEVSERGS